ncbi:class I SAM-dependent methyltransferase [Antrihabitans cavernicola]|uniref:Class I SAM-dependent methyltransferase n=1 Tax=Antrihabitans cavernicola TaxID=2495913 RepID=A0A5A7SD73_9NOCA|nr:class I SAM-dependent methyltransferase [Spelaeibacter cavernicola]KAA0023866.1 class I SAM-dependent methyltransferase [Spelaeibacter cavernicola]
MSACRGCGSTRLDRVLDLGTVPAADHFPLADEPIRPAEIAHPLAMDLCAECGLAQLADDDTVTDEPRGVEPQALKDQAADAVRQVAESGWLQGTSVTEFGSPHGGTWLPLLADRGFTEVDSAADVVLDCFGIMHEPDQQAAFRKRAAALTSDGALLLQYHSLGSIVAQGQWNALRHGHFAYYSMTALTRLVADAGMSIVTAWEFDLYGGTVLIAARKQPTEPDERVTRILATEREGGIVDPAVVRGLARAASQQNESLRTWLETEAAQGTRVYAYGAASRAVALFAMAGLNRNLLAAVADASPSKQGRRMPGTDIPIISPEELVAAEPDRVLLTLPDLLSEVGQSYPELVGRWIVDPHAS